MNHHPEKRQHIRYLFEYPQWMAPVYQGTLPSPWSFQKVRCHNLSAGGMSFYLEMHPRFHECVIAVAKPPELVYLLAKIVNVVPYTSQYQISYRIGCQFLERLRFDEANQSLCFSEEEEKILDS